MEKLKIAIVGCGGIANQKHMPSIRANSFYYTCFIGT